MRERCRTAARALLFAAAICLAPACTAFDDYLPGTPFTLDQPEAEVTLVGEMNSDPVTLAGDGCAAGGTLFWGSVRNTGDLPVTGVRITVVVFDGSGRTLGAFADDVFNGEVTEPEGVENPTFVFAGTSLEVDQAGSFTVCTPVPFGAGVRTEYSTSFLVVEGTE